MKSICKKFVDQHVVPFFFLHLPSVSKRCDCLRTSDHTCDPLETAYLGDGRNLFPLFGMCLWAYFEGEKKTL